MNPEDVFSKNELSKIRDIGINLENRVYTPEECRMIENKIEENIMSESKNNIPNLTCSLSNVLNTLIKYQNNKE